MLITIDIDTLDAGRVADIVDAIAAVLVLLPEQSLIVAGTIEVGN